MVIGGDLEAYKRVFMCRQNSNQPRIELKRTVESNRSAERLILSRVTKAQKIDGVGMMRNCN